MAEEGHPMNAGDDSDFSPAARFKFPTQREIGVHVLSEHVFCPRAALIASESGPDAGDEEPNLGPRLDLFLHYIDLHPTEVRRLNWWSLRKAGFDCLKPPDPLSAPDGDLVGKPWRMLTKGNPIGVPVIRRHRGNSDWGPQHEVRIAAYCDLIEKCQNQSAPFGVILFAGTTDCVIIPNTPAMQQRCRRALESVREFLEIQARGTHIPAAPTDKRCTGCPYGKPREFQRGKSESVFNEKPVTPYTTNSVRPSDGKLRGTFHCTCGDRFKWVPPHRDLVKLGIAKPNSG